MIQSRRRFVGRAIQLISCAPSVVCAQGDLNFPIKPIKIIVPFEPGGSTDFVARIIAPELSAVLGVVVVVENVPGDGGVLGTKRIAESDPDGYTLGMATVSNCGSGPIFRKVLDYDPLIDLVPVINLIDMPGVIASHPSFPATDYQSLIGELRANPGKYSYASSGVGGVGHLGMELFKLRTQTAINHVGFRGAVSALNEVVTGRIPLLWNSLSSSLPFIQRGELRAFGLTSSRRSSQLPLLKTFTEIGVRDYDTSIFFGLIGQQGIKQSVINTVNIACNNVLNNPPTRKALEASGGIVIGQAPGVLRQKFLADFKKWSDVASVVKIRI